MKYLICRDVYEDYDDSIIYIYQGMEGYGTLCQYVSLVQPDDKDRSDVVEYMNEDFVDLIYDEESGVDILNNEIIRGITCFFAWKNITLGDY